jgi:hypothetical protein
VEYKITPLQPRKVAKPARREPAGPVTYDIVSSVPLELESDFDTVVIDQGTLLCKVTLLHGADPELVTKQMAVDINVIGGELKLRRSRRYEGIWLDRGDLIGTVSDLHPNLDETWVLRSIGKIAEYKLSEV